MDVRRRTLVEGPAGNAIPQSYQVPPSAIKKQPTRLGNSRMSMLPTHSNSNLNSAFTAGQSRAPSIGTNNLHVNSNAGGSLGVSHSSSQDGGAFAGGARRSTMMTSRADVGNGGVMSGSRGDGGIYGRPPQAGRVIPGSVRRSSVYGGGRQSMAPGAFSATTVKDTRPTRDKTFQSQCQRNIHDYLTMTRFPMPMTNKTLTSPTQKEFQSVFRFLVTEFIDPGVIWGKKFEDDCTVILKDLRYPAMENAGKTALTAPGSPHTWPGLLAMLNWLVELCKAHDNWMDPEITSDPLLTPANQLPLDHPNLEDRLLWDFCAKTYRAWFDGGAEEFPEFQQELEEVFDRIAANTYEETERYETEISKRQAELHQLQVQEPPLKKLEDEFVQLMSDKTKFIAFIELHKQKAEKIKVGNTRARSAIADSEKSIDARRAELTQIEAAVAAQNLSPDEVNRMNHERETLSRNLDDLRAKIAEASQQSYDQEMLVTKSMDRFEQLLQDYTALAHQIGLINPLNGGLGPDGTDYTLELDLGISDLNEVQQAGKRMRQVIRGGLQLYGEKFRKEGLELSNKMIGLDDEFDRLVQIVERRKEEVGNLEVRLKVIHEQAEEARNQFQAESHETNKTVVKLETEVAAMSNASQQSLLATQNELESLKIEFKELRHKTALLQDSVVAQIMAHTDTVIKAKEHTANSLKSVRTFAESH